jgi:sugar lactone lactonase YvrE
MLWHHLTATLTLATALTVASACTPREAAERSAAGSDSAAADTASGNGGGGARKIGELGNLEAPEAAKYDADQDIWFVANVNGPVVAKDNNGYISRLTPDGKMETQKFIAGGVKGVTLNAPKGMAITGDTLWVADFDVVRAFNRRTGAALTTVPVKGAKFLNDLTAGPDGIYATDTGVLAGEKGFSHPGPDRVYKISGGKASVALESPKLSGPNGITWNRDHFVIVPFMGTEIMSWKPGEKDVKVIATGPGQQDGVEVLSDGRLLTNSWTDSSLFVIDNGKVTKVASGIPSPADHAYDGKSKVLVPLLMENRVELWELR